MNANILFRFDPMAAISYSQYNEVKKEKGSFEDFLLHYNSYEANNGKSDWLTKLMLNEGYFSKIFLHKSSKALDFSKFSFLNNISTSHFLNTKANILKFQLFLK